MSKGNQNHRRRHWVASREGGWICHWCKKELGCHTCDPNSELPPATLEHLKRSAEGGTSDQENLTLACRPCNNERHKYDQPPAKVKKAKPKPVPYPSTPAYPTIWNPELKTFVVDRARKMTVHDSAYPGRIGYIDDEGKTVWLEKKR